MALARIIYYSTCHFRNSRQPRAIQLTASIASLRRQNEDIPVHVFACGGFDDDLRIAIERCRVQVHEVESLQQRMARLVDPRIARELAVYPVLHKWLHFRHPAFHGARQVLYVDSDTYFFRDPAELFDRCQQFNWYAREEPYSRASLYGYRPSYLNEDALGVLAAREGATFIRPCNLGVCLLGEPVPQRLRELDALFIRFVWRFACWMCLNPGGAWDPFSATRDELLGVAPNIELLEPLEFPSSNRWLVEEVALWLVLGRIPELRPAFLPRKDVLQNGEFRNVAPGRLDAFLCHYFATPWEEFQRWLTNESVRSD